jgi:SAM-dependent methyltransferase
VDEVIERYYETAEGERDRLAGWSLERLRTKELLTRFLPPAPARVLDVGGGPGRYASWLADLGYEVVLVDPVARHVAQATEVASGRFSAEQGDARQLRHDDASADAVLLLGPLYHLVERADRVAALCEAARVVRPGGLVAAAAVSRLASLLDGLAPDRRYLADDRFRQMVEGDLSDGVHRNPWGEPDWFTTAFFHAPAQLEAEMAEAGLQEVSVYGIEGPGAVFGDRGREPDDDAWRAAALWAARRLERDPDAIALSDHLLGVGRRLSR